MFLGESHSHLYPHMRAKFWRGPTAVSKKVSFKFISRYAYKNLSFLHTNNVLNTSLPLPIYRYLCNDKDGEILNF